MASYKNVAIRPGNDADVARQVAAIDQGVTMGADQLMTSPGKPPVIPTPLPSTESDGLSALISADADAYTKNLATRADRTNKMREQSLSALLKGLTDSDTEAAMENDMYSDVVDPAEAELSKINQEILAEDVALNRRLDRIKKNEQGLYGGAVEQEMQRIIDESTERKADLSVVQLAKQGAYDSAVKRADRAVAAKFEAQRQRNELLQFAYEENRDMFDKEEQRLFETMQTDRQNKLELEIYKEKARYDQLIKQSDPLYQKQLNEPGPGDRGGEWDTARQFIADNPNASEAEISAYLRENTTKLTDGDITALISEAREKGIFNPALNDDRLNQMATALWDSGVEADEDRSAILKKVDKVTVNGQSISETDKQKLRDLIESKRSWLDKTLPFGR